MPHAIASPLRDQINQFVEPFEQAWCQEAVPEMKPFLPPRFHPYFERIACELILVDLERRWQCGKRKPLRDYAQDVPPVFEVPEHCQELAHAEFCLRREKGEDPTEEEYQREFGVQTEGWDEEPGSSLRSGPTGDSLARWMQQASQAYQQFDQGNEAPLQALLHSARASDPEAQSLLRLMEEVRTDDQQQAKEISEAIAQLPKLGDELLGFRLVHELGHGAFGYVYLAEQRELAHRQVALKVSINLTGEAQILAQMQHTNIVPIYSVHQKGRIQAVCMPYFGCVTFKDLLAELRQLNHLPDSGRAIRSSLQLPSSTRVPADLTLGPNTPVPLPEKEGRTSPTVGKSTEILDKLEKLTYVDGMVLLFSKLAAGLAHAHARGIMHQDLKPANVLFTDEGQPMLLDFNLSTDAKSSIDFSVAQVGGTLPYMSPEHLRAFQKNETNTDPRSDTYSLGVLLFEMLTGTRPFPEEKGATMEKLSEMIDQRYQGPPTLRNLNPAISPAVESIVRHCLEPDPGKRYQTAADLEEDLDRQVNALPLRSAPDPSLRERVKKWTRRHPRTMSALKVGSIAVVLLGILISLWMATLGRLEQSEETRKAREHFEKKFKPAKILAEIRLTAQTDPDRNRKEGIEIAREHVRHYRVAENVNWFLEPQVQALSKENQNELRKGLGDLLLFWSQALRGQALDQKDLEKRNQLLQQALQRNAQARRCYPGDQRPHILDLHRDSIQQLIKEPQRVVLPPQEVSPDSTAQDCYLYAAGLASASNTQQAIVWGERAIEKSPELYPAHLLVGRCYLRLGKNEQAELKFGNCISLVSDFSWGYFNRGLARLKRGGTSWAGHEQEELYSKAKADFTRFVELQPESWEGYLNRAFAYRGLGEFKEALQDLETALRHKGSQTQIHVRRAELYQERAGNRFLDLDFVQGVKDLVAANEEEKLLMKEKPTDAQSHAIRGYYLQKLGDQQLRARDIRAGLRDYNKALRDYNKAIEMNPRDLTTLKNKVTLLARLPDRLPEALEAVDDVERMSAGDSWTLSSRAVYHARLGQRKLAHKAAKEFAQHARTSRDLMFLATVYSLTSMQNYQDGAWALAYLREAVKRGYSWKAVEDDPDLDPIRGGSLYWQIRDAAFVLNPRLAQK